MRKNQIVGAIKRYMDSFKTAMDVFAENYADEKSKNKAYCESMRGKWTDDYISKSISEWKSEKDYCGLVNDARMRARLLLDREFAKLRGNADHFFGDPAGLDFTNSIVAMRLTNMELTKHEIELLQNRVTNYSEQRLLESIVPESEKKTLIDIESTYKQIDDLQRRCNDVIAHYVGEDIELYDICGKPAGYSAPICAAAGNFYRNGDVEKLNETINNLDCFDKVLKPLSENEIAIIDKYVPLDMPYSVKDNVKTACENEILRGLLERDERYSEYVPTEEESA